MPYAQVMPKFNAGKLPMGSKSGPPVKKKKQAVAIMMDEKRRAKRGFKEYTSTRSGGFGVN